MAAKRHLQTNMPEVHYVISHCWHQQWSGMALNVKLDSLAVHHVAAAVPPGTCVIGRRFNLASPWIDHNVIDATYQHFQSSEPSLP
jgi:hypothetical protein